MMLRKQDRRGQAGLTMVELMVAIAVSALIVVGSVVMMTYLVTVADDNRDKTMATLEVQYVGFWVSEDAVQAGNITLGDPELGDPDGDGFPLTLKWDDTQWGGDENEVRYDVVYDEPRDLYQLQREQWVNGISLGASAVGEYLDHEATFCERHQFEFASSLILEVAADFEGSRASSTYEIHPRAFCRWTEY